MWTFKISAGTFSDPTGKVVCTTAYSGHPPHVNDVSAIKIQNQGPLPPGTYGIGQPRNPPDHLGPLAMPLNPSAPTTTYGRNGFFIHGDNQNMDHTASDGCVILPHDVRAMVAQSTDRTLQVIV